VVAVKKQELPAHMPQIKRALGLVYAVNPFGADHESSEHDTAYPHYPERLAQIGLTNPQPPHVLNEEKVRFALLTSYVYSALDTFNICQFVFGPSWHLYDVEELVEAVRHITGWDIDLDELMRVGERRLNLLRAFNAREGFTREDDRLPRKLFKPLQGGASDGVHLDEEAMERAKDLFYQMAGWDENGVPTPEKLHELGLDWITL